MRVLKTHCIDAFPVATFIKSSFAQTDSSWIFGVLGPLRGRIGKGEMIGPER